MTSIDTRRLAKRPPRWICRAIAITAISPVAALAQWSGSGVVQADSLLAGGHLALAESVYYATSSARPRDAVARAALGRYLASRGALRIGAVLLEEARLFGGDSASIARSLAPIYGSLGDYRALAVLPASPLSSAEQARTKWLVSHPPVLEFPDSVAVLPYKPLTDGTGLGVVTIGIGERRVDAVIDPLVSGVVMRGRAARRRGGIRVVGEDSSGSVAIVSELHVGDVTLSNVPARLDTASTHTVKANRSGTFIGLDVLRRLAPTFDAKSDTITLRRSGQLSAATAGTRLPMLLDAQGLRILNAGHWESAASRATAELLATRRWVLDAKRGTIVLQ
jgi:hypothetical protein